MRWLPLRGSKMKSMCDFRNVLKKSWAQWRNIIPSKWRNGATLWVLLSWKRCKNWVVTSSTSSTSVAEQENSESFLVLFCVPWCSVSQLVHADVSSYWHSYFLKLTLIPPPSTVFFFWGTIIPVKPPFPYQRPQPLAVNFFPKGLMEKKGAGFHTSSSTFWDPESDAGTSYRWENKALICVVQVFGIGM